MHRARDLRDPEAIGVLLGQLRKRGIPMLSAADELPAYAVKNYASNESCVEKYGTPDDVKPRFEEIQTR